MTVSFGGAEVAVGFAARGSSAGRVALVGCSVELLGQDREYEVDLLSTDFGEPAGMPSASST